MRTVLLIFLFSGTANATTLSTEVESSFQCNYEGKQQEMNACALRDYKLADAVLNEKYKATISKLSPEKQRSLRQQQRSWLKNRDPNCKAKAKPSEGGSIWQLEYFSCLKSATEHRTKAVESWASNP
jgi:uncharacterized protein YecT (DUF1311 family)